MTSRCRVICAVSPTAEDAEKRRRVQDLLARSRASRADPLSPSQVPRFIESIRESSVQDSQARRVPRRRRSAGASRLSY